MPYPQNDSSGDLGSGLAQLIMTLLLRNKIQANQMMPAAEKEFEAGKIKGDYEALMRMGQKYKGLPKMFQRRTGEQFPMGTPEALPPGFVGPPRTVPNITPEYPMNAQDLQMRVQQDILGGKKVPESLRYIQQEMQAAPYQALARVDPEQQKAAAHAMGIQYKEPIDRQMMKQYPFYNQAMQYYGEFTMSYDQAMDMAKTGQPPQKIARRYPPGHEHYLSPGIIEDFVRTYGYDVQLGNVKQDIFKKELDSFIGSGGTQYPDRTPTLPPRSSPYLSMATQWGPKLALTTPDGKPMGIPEIARRLEMQDPQVMGALNDYGVKAEYRKGMVSSYQTQIRMKDKKGAQKTLRDYAATFGVTLPEKTTIWTQLESLFTSSVADNTPPELVDQMASTWLEAYVKRLQSSEKKVPTEEGPATEDFWKKQGGVSGVIKKLQ